MQSQTLKKTENPPHVEETRSLKIWCNKCESDRDWEVLGFGTGDSSIQVKCIDCDNVADVLPIIELSQLADVTKWVKLLGEATRLLDEAKLGLRIAFLDVT